MYSSADQFHGWHPPHGHGPHEEPLPCVRATSWLLTDGWTRAGPVHLDEVPGPDPSPA